MRDRRTDLFGEDRSMLKRSGEYLVNAVERVFTLIGWSSKVSVTSERKARRTLRKKQKKKPKKSSIGTLISTRLR